MFRPRRYAFAALLSTIAACTDSGVYATGPGGSTGPDRAEITGVACVPLAVGDQFPVKTIFAIEGGKPNVDDQAVMSIVDTLKGLAARFSDDYRSFELVAYHTVASGIQGSFVPAADLDKGANTYSGYNEFGPISLRSPLKLVKSLLSGDMLTGCRGTVARTRYIVVLVIYSADQSCANPSFNAGIDADCNAFISQASPDYNQCSTCELTRRVEDLRKLAAQYGAGEVVVQPVYVRSSIDDTTQFQAHAIAQAGGTTLISTDPANLKTNLNNIDYGSLQRSLKLKRLIAFNRNTVSRNGQLLVDSDGDGLPDDDEKSFGTNPTLADTDDDRLSDGIEVRMAMNPLSFDTLHGCNPDADTDGDRLDDCEERVLGTDACISDTDGDGLPDFVEFHAGTNPLVPEDLDDDDHDGRTNVEEVLAHTDPGSADIAYAQNRGYGYFIDENDAAGNPIFTADGRACYHVDAYNLSLVKTLSRKTLLGTVPEGTNELYLYLMVGRENDPRGTGIGSLFATTVQFIPPQRKKPKGGITVTPEDFVTGD